MADPESNSRSRRLARSQRARRHRWVVGGGIVLAVAGTATALLATGVVALSDGGSTTPTTTARVAIGTTTTTAPAKAPPRRLTVDQPLRLWIAGDSLAGSVGPALGQMTADTGVVAPEYDSRVSSGLLSPNFFDWPKHAKQQLDVIDPEVVVFLVGTNDANVWSNRLGPEYRARTEAMMRILAGNGRQVYWIGPPVARASDLERGSIAVGLIARAAASKVKGVTYVDAHGLFDDANGDYQQSFADETGKRHVMRAGDGVHFSVDGADYLSRFVFRLLDESWDILAQADPSHPQKVKETEGSTQVPGTHRSVNTRTGVTSTTRATATTTTTTTTTTTVAPPDTTPSTSSTTTPTTPTTPAT